MAPLRRNYIFDSFNHSANDYAWYSDSDQDACEYVGNMVSGVLNGDNQNQLEALPLIVVSNVWAETETSGSGTILLQANVTADSTYSVHTLGVGFTEEGNVVDGQGGEAAFVDSYRMSYEAICTGNIAGETLPRVGDTVLPAALTRPRRRWPGRRLWRLMVAGGFGGPAWEKQCPLLSQ